MLVLARKVGEKLWIGESICLTVIEVARGKVRFGIDAPRDVPVDRDEIRQLKLARESEKTVE